MCLIHRCSHLCSYVFNKYIDIEFTAQCAFLREPSSDTFKIERLESQIILKSLGLWKHKGLIQDTKVNFEWEISFGLIIIILFRNCIFKHHNILLSNQVGDVMVGVFASSVVDRGFKPWSGQTKDYKIGMCCFSTKHAALRSKSKDWLARNQNNVSEWNDMSTHRLLFQWLSIIQIKLSVLV